MSSRDSPSDRDDETSNEGQPGLWHMVWDSGAPAPAIRDQQDNTIVTIAKSSEEKMLARASLIAAAPELYEATLASLQVFTVFSQRFEGPVADSAQDMIPMLQSVIDGASFLGQISKGAMTGK
ncbi:MAG TPA: hypothetical protein VEG60_07700 [Candidatus Binatia bacterium]|nr:hypothetical protein [Candidatus Binatia bacterium]